MGLIELKRLKGAEFSRCHVEFPRASLVRSATLDLSKAQRCVLGRELSNLIKCLEAKEPKEAKEDKEAKEAEEAQTN